MKFGLLYEMQRPHEDYKVDYTALIEETIEQCQLADEVGFDYLWFVEHHFLTTFSGSSAPEVIISALARLTKRVRLGFGVVILGNHRPTQVAERVAMVDHLSGGRVEFGVGRSSPYEQLGMGVDPRDTRDLMEESLRMVPEIWRTEGNFEWEGQFYNIPPREILPKPKQDPHPPIWMACTQPSSYEMAAHHGVGVLSFGSGAPAGMKQHVDKYREDIKSADPVGSAVNNQWASFTLGHCGDNNAEAQELGARAIKEFLRPQPALLIRPAGRRTSGCWRRGAACRSTCRRTSSASWAASRTWAAAASHERCWASCPPTCCASVASSSRATRIAASTLCADTRRSAPTRRC